MEIILEYFKTIVCNPHYKYAIMSIFLLFQFVISEVIPQMGDASSATNRQGAIETVACIHSVHNSNVFKLSIVTQPVLT